MRKAEARKNKALPDLTKRPRGRPRQADALTPAQRAKRYRDNKREKMGDAQSTIAAPDSQIHADGAENLRLQRDLQEAQKRIRDLVGAIDVVVAVAAKGRRIPLEMLKGLHRLLASN